MTQVDEILAKALTIGDAAQRAMWLDEVCSELPGIRQEVENRLMHHNAHPSPNATTGFTEPTNCGLYESVLTQMPGSEKTVASLRLSDDGSRTGEAKPWLELDANSSRYLLYGEIDRGGIGAILKCRDVDLGRDLAVKVLLDSHHDNSDLTRRLIEEAQIGGQLQHPGIAPVYELGQTSDHRPFFTMKLVKGETLSSLLRKRSSGGEDTTRFLQIFEDVCQTLAYAHSRGVLHRDLKPSNIMIGKFGEVQVMDWGLAKVLTRMDSSETEIQQDYPSEALSIIETTSLQGVSGDTEQPNSLTRNGSVLGTPAYMPPEQAMGEVERLDERADVFGLGAILCEILTGKPPYTAKSSTEIFRMAAMGNLAGCNKRLEACQGEPELVSLARDCLQPEMETRLRDARVVAKRIAGFFESVQSRLREAEIREAAEAARAKEALQTAKESQEKVSAERRSKRLQLGLAMVVLAFTGAVACFSLVLARFQKDKKELIAKSLETQTQYLYVAQMQMADQAWREGSMLRLRNLLDRHVPQDPAVDYRQADWYLLDLYCRHVESSPSVDYGDIVVNVEVDPLERFVVATGNDFKIRIYNLDDLKLLKTLEGHNQKVEAIFISPDGKNVLTSNSDEFRLWRDRSQADSYGDFSEVLGGKARLPANTRLSPDGSYALVAESETTIMVLDLTQEEPTVESLEFPTGIADLICLNKRPGFLVALNDGRVLLRDAIGDGLGDVLLSLPDPAKKIIVSSDDRFLATSNAKSTSIFELSDEGTSELHHELGAPEGNIRDLTSVDSTFAIVSDTCIKTWDFETGEAYKRIPVQESATITPSRYDPLIASYSLDNIVSVYSLETGQLVSQLKGHNNIVYAAVFAPDGRLVSGSRDESIRILNDKDSPSVPLTLEGHTDWIWCVDFSPDGKTIASASKDSNVILWDTSTGEELGKLTDHTASVQTVLFSPSGDLLATSSADKTIKLWSIESRKITGELIGHSDKVNGLCFTPDGSQLISVGDDGAVIVWNTATRKELFRYQTEQGVVWSVALAKDGTVVFGGTDHSLYKWDYRTGSGPELYHEFDANITSARFSPDGKTLVTTTADGATTLFDYNAQHVEAQPTAHTSDAMSADFSPDGGELVSAGLDGRIRFWSMLVNEPTISLVAHEDYVPHLRYSPDGTMLASASWDGTVKLWKLRDSPAKTK